MRFFAFSKKTGGTCAVIFILFIHASFYKLEATCIEGDCNNGVGVATYGDGDIYKGEWKNNKAEGTGTLTYKSGNVYVGEWKNGMATGNGTLTFANGDKYEGEWLESRAHGKGKLTDKSGKVLFDGEWRNGKKIESSK